MIDPLWSVRVPWAGVSVRAGSSLGVPISLRAPDVAQIPAATIVLGRFFTSVRALAWPLAATRGVGYAKFLALDILAATAWATLWVGLGWFMGDRWASAAEQAGIWLGIAGAITLAVVVAPFAMRVWRRRARRRRRAGAGVRR